jgi:hypothetical protein
MAISAVVTQVPKGQKALALVRADASDAAAAIGGLVKKRSPLRPKAAIKWITIVTA